MVYDLNGTKVSAAFTAAFDYKLAHYSFFALLVNNCGNIPIQLCSFYRNWGETIFKVFLYV